MAVLQGALDTKQIALYTLLDIEGAFDNTPHTETQDALTHKEVENTLFFWMLRMFKVIHSMEYHHRLYGLW